jgi:NADPH-dependent curcumin reductase
MRGRMSDAKSYAKPVGIGEVMTGGTVGEVVRSNDPKFKPGDVVLGMGGWQDYAIMDGKELRKLDPNAAPLSTALGVLGMPGMTAYTGLLNIGQPKAGETVAVAAATGPVGSLVGQIARMRGCRAVGIAGGRAKCDYVVQELGLDACVDYKAGNLFDGLKKACPKGIDVLFENVGGEILDAELRLMNVFGRIVICGLIAEYNATQPYAYKNMRSVLVNRIRMQGMIVFDWKERYGEALKALGGYFAAGKLKTRESVVEGLANAPQGLITLLKGGNFGKQLVKLA